MSDDQKLLLKPNEPDWDRLKRILSREGYQPIRPEVVQLYEFEVKRKRPAEK